MTTVPALAPIDEDAPRAGNEPLDLVFIEGLTGQSVIGIHESELHRPQPLVIDVCVGMPRARACDTDRIADTVDYGELRTRLLLLMANHRVQLLERFAEQVAHIALYEFQAHWVRVRVAKPHKFDDVAKVGVMIERRRTVPPDSGSRAATLYLLGAGLVPGGR
jgi:7,8-dihydroneopterin aldolase/epimerase/oxygenase